LALIIGILTPVLAFALQASTVDGSLSLPEGSYVLGANDRISIRCVNADEFAPTPIRIDNDGRVSLPFVGRIQLAGLTVNDAEKQLTDQLSRYIQNPQIQLNVIESHSQPVSVFGAVRNPGSYQLEGRKTLAEVLSLAGGLRPDAGRKLKITRNREWGSIPVSVTPQQVLRDVTVGELDLDELVRGHGPFADIEVRPHDVISVSQAQLVYVVGQVRKPGGFAMPNQSDFTVLQALSLAEGLDRAAAPKKAKILRKQGGPGRLEITIDLAQILSGRAPDTPMLAEDVLFVPNNTAKSAGVKTLDTILQMTTGMAIYGRY
jgi:polysaccharide export outer membrane protein